MNSLPHIEKLTVRRGEKGILKFRSPFKVILQMFNLVPSVPFFYRFQSALTSSLRLELKYGY